MLPEMKYKVIYG